MNNFYALTLALDIKLMLYFSAHFIFIMKCYHKCYILSDDILDYI